MTSFNRQFLSTFLRRQPFDLPDSVIYYILKNPKSSKVYQKMVQCCKYFFVKNPILVFHCLEINDNGWKICSNQTYDDEYIFQQRINSRIISSCKLWIGDQIRIFSTDSNAAANLIPKFYQGDAKQVWLKNQKMSFQQFSFYVQNAEKCVLEEAIVSFPVSVELQLEQIIANLPLNCLTVYITFGPDSKNASSDNVSKSLQIPSLKQITKLGILCFSEKFDIDPIYDYYKKNRSRFTFGVTFENELSEDFARKLDGIVQEILDYEYVDNETPFITYKDQNIVYRINLLELSQKAKDSKP